MDTKDIRFPFPVMDELTATDVQRWNRFYENPIVRSRDPRYEEGLWRRTQSERNREQSGWDDSNDARRRMMHYEYRYEMIGAEGSGRPRLAMADFYLWWHVCLPEEEIVSHLDRCYACLQVGGWKKAYGMDEHEQIFTHGDLYVRLSRDDPKDNPYDRSEGRSFPRGYRILEVTFFSFGNSKSVAFLAKPWTILGTGIRERDVRGRPRLNPWSDLPDFFPAQVELGCGPSIEAGIPPLDHLHQTYYVTDSGTGRFILDPYEDRLVADILNRPGEALVSLSETYRKCFIAQPTDFYRLLKELSDSGSVVGPVITNNFDGLAGRVGLSELYVRRYEEACIIPDMKFHPKAKSLIVVGSHADRRRIRCAARRQGLRVVYVDPEGYLTDSGFAGYPLESIRDDDVLFRVTAEEFSKKLRTLLMSARRL